MSVYLHVTIPGPAPTKGSRRTVHTKTGRHLSLDDSPALHSWESLALDRMEAVRPEKPLDCAVELRLVVEKRRPKSHYGTGRNEGVLRPGVPDVPGTGVDLDKVARAVFDCCKRAGWVVDDARVARLFEWREWCGRGPECVRVAMRIARAVRVPDLGLASSPESPPGGLEGARSVETGSWRV